MDKDIRYIMADGTDTVHAAYPWGTRGQWDFSIPPYKGLGFRMIDLHTTDRLDYWLSKLSTFQETL